MLAASVVTLAEEASPYAGLSVVDAITRMEQEHGLAIVYSSELVARSMTVAEEPKAVDPIALLTEILEPHGLALAPGPRASWLIVRRPGAWAATAEPRADPPLPHQATGPAPPPPLEAVVVSASRYAISRDPAVSSQHLTRGQLENYPTLGEDAMRTSHGLPGFTSSGLSARFNVRGGEANEALVYLDGMRLHDPFHLKDFQGLFSSIDPRMLEEIELRTGAFPAMFGDRMSAVVDMRSLEPVQHRLHEIGVSLFTSSVLSSGRFAADRGSWVTSLRRGNLDVLSDALNSDVGKPRYVDFFNKLSYSITPALTVSGNALLLSDQIVLRDGDVAQAHADYDDTYVWVSFDHAPEQAFSGRYLLGHTRLVANRAGSIDDALRSTGALSESRRIDVDAIKADWGYELSDWHLVQWGLELKQAQAEYHFDSSVLFAQPIETGGFERPDPNILADTQLSGRQSAVYASYRVRPRANIIAELGLRWDGQTYLDDEQLSPRISLLIDVGARTSLRASWGRFYQAQGLDELQISDGVTELFAPQEADHAVLSMEFFIGRNTTVRVEAYEKAFGDLRPRFENLFAHVSLLPELLPDRVRIDPLAGRARGVELAADGELGRWSWWTNLVRSSVKDRFATGAARRRWEEPWSVKGGATWTGDLWTVSVAVTSRSGWPSTPLELVEGKLTAGKYNASRFGRFRSLDVRSSRRIPLERGELTLFVELTNALNHSNDCCLEYDLRTNPATGSRTLVTKASQWLSTVPSIGVLWQF